MGHGGSVVPKDPDKRQRRNKPAELIELAGGAVPAPPMPTGDWSAQVVQWWETWASSPQSSEFTATDWQRLEMLMPLVESYWDGPDVKILSEIRQNEERFGATPIDRKRLGWKLSGEPAEAKKPRKPTRKKADPRREHLKAV